MEEKSLLPVREFPDSGAKWLLSASENVFGLIQILSAEIASRLDFSRLRDDKTSFVLDSLRKQISDLVFIVPFFDVTCETEREVLIFILIEHQSKPVMSMGFRMLLYMTLIWDEQRREWEKKKVKESEWRFRPILPVLFYTGDSNWNTPLSVTALMDLPTELEPFVPQYKTLFLNLNAIAPEKLTEHPHLFGWILRIIQKEKTSLENLVDELKQAVENIDKLTVDERIQWQRAIHYLLLLIYHRREPEEHAQLTDIVSKSVQNRKRQEEVSNMGRTIAQSLIEEGREIGMKLGIEEGQIKNAQSSTLDVLNARFPVPYPTLTDLKERVQRIENLSVLRNLLTDAVKIESLDDFVKRLDELQV